MPSWSGLILAAVLVLPSGAARGDETFSAAPADELVDSFVRAEPEERDALLEQILDLTTDAEAVAALQARIARHERTLGRGSTPGKLDRLLAARRELDEARDRFFAIVEDEARYFTPYRQPEVSSEKEAEYRRTQKEVER